MVIPNLLLIAGTGNKSGKTTLACRVIEQFRQSGISAVKITPHFHDITLDFFCFPRTKVTPYMKIRSAIGKRYFTDA